MLEKQPLFIIFANARLESRKDLKPIIEAFDAEFKNVLPVGAELIHSPEHAWKYMPDEYSTIGTEAEDLEPWKVDWEPWSAYEMITAGAGITSLIIHCMDCSLLAYRKIWARRMKRREEPISCLACHQDLLRKTLDSIIKGKTLGYACVDAWVDAANAVRIPGVITLGDEGELQTIDQLASWDEEGDIYYDPPLSFLWFLSHYVGLSLCSFLMKNNRSRLGRCLWCRAYFISRADAKFCSAKCRGHYHNARPETAKKKRDYEKKHAHQRKIRRVLSEMKRTS
jgi:hypothetical protein